MYNHCVLIGRLTAAPELKQTGSGVSVTSFTLAIDRPYSKDGTRQTDFINCVAWRSTAEFISKYFEKGRQLGLDGSIQTRNYEDKKGNKRTAVEVVVDNAFFVDSRPKGWDNTPKDIAIQEDGFREIDDDQDLPF